MSTEFDRQGLISIFVTEATDGLAQLRAALHPPDGSLPTPQAMRTQYIVGHSLRGAAALYSFTGVAGLAEILEAILERADGVPDAEWAGVLAKLNELVDTLRVQVEAIGRTGVEDPICVQHLEQWKATCPQVAPDEPASQSDTLPITTLTDSYLNPDLDPEVFSYFAPEAQEYLDAIEASLLRLEKEPDDAEMIQQLFRTAHTLKGSAYTVGFQAIGDITHHVEDFMGAIREGRMRVTPGVTDLIFRTVDAIRLLMRRDPRNLGNTRREFAAVMQRLRQADLAPAPEVSPAPAPIEPLEGQQAEPPDLQERQEAGAREELGSTKSMESAVIRVSRDRLERLLNLVGELVIGRGRLEQRLLVLEQLSNQVLMCKGRMVEAVRSFEERHAYSSPAPLPSADEPSFSGFQGLADFGTLEFDKYDDFNILARRIAELSADVSESMSQLSGSIRRARDDMSQLQRLTLGMRDEIARARMVPIGTPFTRFRRAVREMAKATGKEVTLSIAGEHTEVDTGVVERLVEPLIHLVRNAVYHGIETPAVRVARGKPVTGTVYLHAAHRGNAVVIEVEDDGAGLDLEKIKAKAVGLGVLRPEAAPTLPDVEAIKLIFLPGFSTAQGVGDQAGRGVGLDVVKKTVEAMHGRIEIETERGVGTKFTLSLPLTLLISMALLVRVGNDRYAIPLPSIREVVLPPVGAIQDIGGRPILQVGEETIEVQPLAQLLGWEPPVADRPIPVVIVRTATGALGLAVDELLGRQEIVIKSLGTLKPLQESCFGGATIDPEGRVVLVLDVGRLVTGQDGALTLPVQAESPLLAEPGATAGSDAQAVATDEPRLLLIDDSLSVRKFVGRMLEGAGYVVETAVDGEEGLRKASDGSYRLIITDLEMPKLNGYEVIQALRDRPQTKATPILVMTTRAGEKHRQMALSMGASAYVAKPVEERALIREVEHWIGREAGTRR